jgi:type I restriction enzyme S subunit
MTRSSTRLGLLIFMSQLPDETVEFLGTHPGYVFFHLFAGCVNRQIDALLTGSNDPAINSADVRVLQIPFPSLLEQTVITEVLTEMNAELATLTQRREKTRALTQAMMQVLLTGRIRLV